MTLTPNLDQALADVEHAARRHVEACSDLLCHLLGALGEIPAADLQPGDRFVDVLNRQWTVAEHCRPIPVFGGNALQVWVAEQARPIHLDPDERMPLLGSVVSDEHAVREALYESTVAMTPDPIDYRDEVA